jgi:hypothetical protein
MPRKQATGPIGPRVKYLVDTYFEGNVTKGARELGVSQRALHKLYTGQTPHPRLGMIQALLTRLPDVDARWLVLGVPSEDARRFEQATRARAEHVAKAYWKRFDQGDDYPWIPGLEPEPERDLFSDQPETAKSVRERSPRYAKPKRRTKS